MECEIKYGRKVKKQKKISNDIPLDACANAQSNVAQSNIDDVSPMDIFILEKKMDDTKKKRLPKLDSDTIQSKEILFRKNWYSLFGTTYGTWSPSLQDYYIDYELLWKNIVEPELCARGAYLTWRMNPCKKIGTVLPKGFISWSQFLRNGGIVDEATNQGNLTDEEKKYFWNDQCSCPCWDPFPKHSVQISVKQTCVCKSVPCKCDEIAVDNAWETKLKYFQKVKKCFPSINVEASIQSIQEKIQKKIPPMKNETYREFILAKQEKNEYLIQIRNEEIQKESHVEKCFNFFYALEHNYVQKHRRNPQRGEDLLFDFWKNKEEFLNIYRKKCTEERFQLLYISF